MSDCSTRAFKVPEGMCSCNRSRGYDELQQRYAQSQADLREAVNEIVECELHIERLEQVCRKLLEAIDQLRHPIDPVLDVIVEDAREALGVTLDD